MGANAGVETNHKVTATMHRDFTNEGNYMVVFRKMANRQIHLERPPAKATLSDANSCTLVRLELPRGVPEVRH